MAWEVRPSCMSQHHLVPGMAFLEFSFEEIIWVRFRKKIWTPKLKVINLILNHYIIHFYLTKGDTNDHKTFVITWVQQKQFDKLFLSWALVFAKVLRSMSHLIHCSCLALSIKRFAKCTMTYYTNWASLAQKCRLISLFKKFKICHMSF